MKLNDDTIQHIMLEYTLKSHALAVLSPLNTNINNNIKKYCHALKTIKRFVKQHFIKKRFARNLVKHIKNNVYISDIVEILQPYWELSLGGFLSDTFCLLIDNKTKRMFAHDIFPMRRRPKIYATKGARSNSWYGDVTIVENRKVALDATYFTLIGKTRAIRKRPNVAALVY